MSRAPQKLNPRYLKPPACQGCSLEHAGFGFAPAIGPRSSRLLFVGEALGFEEALAGEPFFGAAGGVLSRILRRAGIERSHVRIANVVSCRPPNDYLAGAPYEAHAVQMCRQYLQPYLDELPDNGVVVTLGATPLQAVLGLYGVAGVAVKDFHGTVNRDPSGRFWVVPTFHPSHLQRGAMNLLDVVTEDVKAAERVSREGFAPQETVLVVDPPVEYFARWVDDHLARVAQDRDAHGLDADTEFIVGGSRKPDDEGEITGDVGNVTLTRFNFGNDGVHGGTVPYIGDFIKHVDRLLSGIARLGGWIYWWNKYADLDPLLRAGHDFAAAENLDLMWLAHHIQSDLPRGLGFWAPMACTFGPWKHWSKVRELEGKYAACDGVKTTRVRHYLLRAAHQLGMMEMFLRDWHERDRYVLRPAHVMGVPVNKPVLVEYHEEMQRKLARILVSMKACQAAGVRKPKAGYAKRPKGAMLTPPRCSACGATSPTKTHLKTCSVDPSNPGDLRAELVPATYAEPTPPASILGKATQTKTGLTDATGAAQTIGGEAKFAYLKEGVQLVHAQIEAEVRCCESCGAADVGAKHRCPRAAELRGRARGRREPEADDVPAEAGDGAAAAPGAPRLVTRRVLVDRWFWQLPFNPDAAAQILAYIEGRGIAAPVDKKRVDAEGRAKKTTNKEALKKLAKEYKDDPFFQLQLDWKAVQKVDATYAVGTLRRLDGDSRVHPEYLPKPSTLRDSAINPNLTNVVADKSGPEALSSGFRRCIEARDGVPPGVTAEELSAWQLRYGVTP